MWPGERKVVGGWRGGREGGEGWEEGCTGKRNLIERAEQSVLTPRSSVGTCDRPPRGPFSLRVGSASTLLIGRHPVNATEVFGVAFHPERGPVNTEIRKALEGRKSKHQKDPDEHVTEH